MRHKSRGFLMLGMALLSTSCSHPSRVSPGALNRLTKSGEPFVLVFGSLSTSGGKLDHPTIRFLHPNNSSAPDDLLWSLTVSSGDRFYAVLHAPPATSYLDGFYTEVGSVEAGFDRIIYARIREGEAPLAVYVGELSVSPAQERTVRGQKVVVTARDDFQNAQQELRRLYPRFEGAIRKFAPVRNPSARQAPATRNRLLLTGREDRIGHSQDDL